MMSVWKNNKAGDNMRRIAALSLAVLLLVSIGCGQSGKDQAAAIPQDAKMLNMTLTDVNGSPINMRQHLGKVVILDFWDTWCGPCQREIPHFVELYNQYKDKGLVVVGVAFARQGSEAVKQFGGRVNMSYTNAIFNDEAKALFGSPPSIPTTYVIDQKGEINEKVVGYRDKSYFENKIKTLLKIS
jgi:cytochrome c biogenesis protein CcmG/thiol:disulfide interchange protein DsbE